MINKILMITTAVVALGAAPAVFAQGNGNAKGTPTNRFSSTPSTMSTTAPAPTAGTTAEMKPMSGKSADMSAKPSQKKMMHASAKQQRSMRGSGLRQQNAQEIQMTKDLNRNGIGNVPARTSANTMSGPTGTQGAMVPAISQDKGASGSSQPGSNNN